MLSAKQQKVLLVSSQTRLRIYFGYHRLLLFSILELFWKILVVTGLLITIFSNHWARSPDRFDRYAGYKNRCSVHVCISRKSDPTWLVDVTGLLSIINLLMEFINVSIIWYFPSQLKKSDILLGWMFVLTTVISDCGIVFGVYITSYAYQFPMGYGYYCFMCAVFFSIVDWTCSLKRFISGWPEVISFNPAEVSQHTTSTRTTSSQKRISVSEALICSHGNVQPI